MCSNSHHDPVLLLADWFPLTLTEGLHTSCQLLTTSIYNCGNLQGVLQMAHHPQRSTSQCWSGSQQIVLHTSNIQFRRVKVLLLVTLSFTSYNTPTSLRPNDSMYHKYMYICKLEAQVTTVPMKINRNHEGGSTKWAECLVTNQETSWL